MAQAAQRLDQTLRSNVSGTRRAVREFAADRQDSIAPVSSTDTPPELMIRGLMVVAIPAALFWGMVLGTYLALR